MWTRAISCHFWEESGDSNRVIPCQQLHFMAQIFGPHVQWNLFYYLRGRNTDFMWRGLRTKRCTCTHVIKMSGSLPIDLDCVNSVTLSGWLLLCCNLGRVWERGCAKIFGSVAEKPTMNDGEGQHYWAKGQAGSHLTLLVKVIVVYTVWYSIHSFTSLPNTSFMCLPISYPAESILPCLSVISESSLGILTMLHITYDPIWA